MTGEHEEGDLMNNCYIFTFAHPETPEHDRALAHYEFEPGSNTKSYAAFFHEVPEGMRKDMMIPDVLFEQQLDDYRAGTQLSRHESIVSVLVKLYLPHVLEKCQELLDRTAKRVP